MSVDEKVTLSLPARIAYFPIAACAAGQCAAGRGFSEDDGNAICLALEEAVSNAIEMGYGGPSDALEIPFRQYRMLLSEPRSYQI